MRFQLIPTQHRTCIKGLQSKSEANQFLSLLSLQSGFIQVLLRGIGTLEVR